MGWIKQEFQDRLRALQFRGEDAGEVQFEQAAAQRWSELVSQLKADVSEYNQQGGKAELASSSPAQCRITNNDTGLILQLDADLPGHSIHYWFESKASRVAPPEGGIFSLRPSRWGRAELYSSDQRVNSEAARRLLLEPVLFPTESAA